MRATTSRSWTRACPVTAAWPICWPRPDPGGRRSRPWCARTSSAAAGTPTTPSNWNANWVTVTFCCSPPTSHSTWTAPTRPPSFCAAPSRTSPSTSACPSNAACGAACAPTPPRATTSAKSWTATSPNGSRTRPPPRQRRAAPKPCWPWMRSAPRSSRRSTPCASLRSSGCRPFRPACPPIRSPTRPPTRRPGGRSAGSTRFWPIRSTPGIRCSAAAVKASPPHRTSGTGQSGPPTAPLWTGRPGKPRSGSGPSTAAPATPAAPPRTPTAPTRCGPGCGARSAPAACAATRR